MKEKTEGIIAAIAVAYAFFMLGWMGYAAIRMPEMEFKHTFSIKQTSHCKMKFGRDLCGSPESIPNPDYIKHTP